MGNQVRSMELEIYDTTLRDGSQQEGISLTVNTVQGPAFTVAIIPYTFAHTNFSTLVKGDIVNLEFDIIGKYVQKLLASRS